MDRREYSDTLYELGKRRRSRRRINLILRTYTSFGLLLSIVAGGFFLLTLLPFDLSNQQQWSLMAAGVGVLLSLMSRFLITFYKEREAETLERITEYERLGHFLSAWAEFERVSRKMLADQGVDRKVHSLRSIISFLYRMEKIDREDVFVLEEGLKIRNSIVHGERLTSARVTERLTNFLGEVIRKIEVVA